MEQIQFVSTSPNALANLIGEQMREQLEAHATKLLNTSRPDVKEVLTRKETAQFFGVSLVTVNDWSKAGILWPYKVGNRVFFRRSQLMQVLEQSNPQKA